MQIFDGQTAHAAREVQRFVDARAQTGGHVDDRLPPAPDTGHEFGQRAEALHPLPQKKFTLPVDEAGGSGLVQLRLLCLQLLFGQLGDSLRVLRDLGRALELRRLRRRVTYLRRGRALGGGLRGDLFEVARSEAALYPINRAKQQGPIAREVLPVDRPAASDVDDRRSVVFPEVLLNELAEAQAEV